MEPAVYLNSAGVQVSCVIAATNGDGTVDIAGSETSHVFAKGLKLSAKPKKSCVHLLSSVKVDSGNKQPTAEELAKALADAQAALKIAEDNFAADPTNADLGKRVDELRAAVEQLQD